MRDPRRMKHNSFILIIQGTVFVQFKPYIRLIAPGIDCLRSCEHLKTSSGFQVVNCIFIVGIQSYPSNPTRPYMRAIHICYTLFHLQIIL
jgi:hypothetical protein